MTLHRILIVDDDNQIQTMLRIGLESAGYETRPALTGQEAVRLAASIAPDAILLDLGLPDRDGKEVLQDIRAFSQVPIIILSARDREAEKVAALDLGADDYLEKPFGISELQARLRTAARHAARGKGEVMRLELGDLTIDLDKHLVQRAGQALRLTPKEYELLAVLVRNAGKVVTHRQILSAVWGPAHHDDTQYLRVFVGQLRAKIEPDPANPTLIRTEPGAGYRFLES
jgi:two-component system, OmpR family, KDP operon response regulator KdpE